MSDLAAEIRQWLAYSADDLSYGALGRESLPRAASWSFQQSATQQLEPRETKSFTRHLQFATPQMIVRQ